MSSAGGGMNGWSFSSSSASVLFVVSSRLRMGVRTGRSPMSVLMSINGLAGIREDLLVEDDAALAGLRGWTRLARGKSSESPSELSDSWWWWGGLDGGADDWALARTDARRAALSGVSALVAVEALDRGSGDRVACGREDLARDVEATACDDDGWPVSDWAREAVVVRRTRVDRRWSFLIGSLSLATASSTCDPDGSESEAEEVELVGPTDQAGEWVAGRTAELGSDGVVEMDKGTDVRLGLLVSRRRVSGEEGEGEFARLLRACASRKAPTEMRWEESEATLTRRGLGTAGGTAGGHARRGCEGVEEALI